jgi:vitamin B12 transporter
MKKTTLASAIAIAAYTSLSFAQESIEILITPLNTEQKAEQVTADVSVITSQDIEAKGYTSLTEVLDREAGLGLVQNGPLGQTANLYIRGLDAKNIVILIDGIRFNEPSSLTGSPFSDLLLANIDRIEILKGAQSGIWGADASSGVINIISKKAQQNGTQGQVTLGLGRWQTEETQVNLLHKQGNLALSLGHQHYVSESVSARSNPDQNPTQLENDPVSITQRNLQLSYQIAPETQISMLHKHTQSRIEYDSGSADSNAINLNQHQFHQFNFQHRWSEQVKQSISFNKAEFEREYPDPNFPYTALSQTQEWTLLTHLGKSNNTTLSLNQLELESGADGYTQQSVGVTHFTELGQATKMNLALRHDDFDGAFNNKTTGKIGLKFTLNDDITLSGNLGTGYNAPNLFQLSTNQSTTTPGITAPTPESVTTIDLQMAHSKGLKATLFDTRVTDKISYFDPDPIQFPNDGWNNKDYYYKNDRGTTHLYGLELEYKTRVDSVELSMLASALESKDPEGDRVVGVPHQRVQIDALWNVNPELSLGGDVQWIGEQPDNEQANYSGNYALVGLRASYMLNADTRLLAKISNLLNEDTQPVEGFSQPPLAWSLKFTHQF